MYNLKVIGTYLQSALLVTRHIMQLSSSSSLSYSFIKQQTERCCANRNETGEKT